MTVETVVGICWHVQVETCWTWFGSGTCGSLRTVLSCAGDFWCWTWRRGAWYHCTRTCCIFSCTFSSWQAKPSSRTFYLSLFRVAYLSSRTHLCAILHRLLSQRTNIAYESSWTVEVSTIVAVSSCRIDALTCRFYHATLLLWPGTFSDKVLTIRALMEHGFCPEYRLLNVWILGSQRDVWGWLGSCGVWLEAGEGLLAYLYLGLIQVFSVRETETLFLKASVLWLINIDVRCAIRELWVCKIPSPLFILCQNRRSQLWPWLLISYRSANWACNICALLLCEIVCSKCTNFIVEVDIITVNAVLIVETRKSFCFQKTSYFIYQSWVFSIAISVSC